MTKKKKKPKNDNKIKKISIFNKNKISNFLIHLAKIKHLLQFNKIL